MSKFNESNGGINITTNQEGHVAYKMKDKELLVTQVLTSFFGEQKFYGDNTNALKETAERVILADSKFVANLARYARKEMHLRSVSHYLTALIAKTMQSKPFIKEVVKDVVERPDDITEILSAYIKMFGKPISNGLKKALAESLNKFNEFQFSKYNGGNKALKFKDVLALVHAKPKNKEQSIIFKKIIENTLEVADRWETELSANGNNKETWEKLIAENKIGYMAMLKNLRNILNSNAENIGLVLNKLQNKEEVAKSKQLPFRFFSAYRELKDNSNFTSGVIDCLENAIENSMQNLPKIKGKTIIAIDVSGSMNNVISEKSSVKANEIGALLGAISNKMCEDVILYTFDTKLKQYSISSRDGILSTTDKLVFDGGGTNISLALRKMLADKIYADRIIIISDNEINCQWESTCQVIADDYRKTINKNLWVHAIDLMGYGTQQFIGGKTNIIAGWSENILEFIALAENGIDTQVSLIEKY